MIDVAMQIFFLLNPLTAIPILLIAYEKKFDVKSIAMKAIMIAFATAIIFVLVGPLLFQIFNITLDAFKAAGGIMIMLLGLSMARPSEDRSKRDVTGTDALISLLATPLLTGPATMSYLAIKTAEIGVIALMAPIATAFVFVGIIFLGAAWMMPNINLKYINLISRIFGLFLLALGIEMLMTGIKATLLV